MLQQVLLLHSYPPTPCLYPFEKGLRELGFEVVSIGPEGEYGDAAQFRAVEPDCRYLSAPADAHVEDLFRLAGSVPDWLMYLQPNGTFFPRGLVDCPVPTVGWLIDDYKFADMDQHLYYYFDLAPTAFPQLESLYRERGYDHRVCFNFIGANWLTPDEEFTARPIDVAFIGTLDPHLSRTRCRELEKLRRLAREGIKVFVNNGIFLKEMLRVYAQSKIVFQHSGQGENNLTYRVSEAMCAGALVLSKRPKHLGGLGEKTLEEDLHIVYYEDFEEAAEKIRYFANHEDERRRIAENGKRYVQAEFPWVEQIRRFVEECVRGIPPDFRARRKERLERFKVDARRERLDLARYFVMVGKRGDVAQKLLEEIPDWQSDPHVRGARALAGIVGGDSTTYTEDIAATNRLCPNHPLILYNHAVLFFDHRKVVGQARALQANMDAILVLKRLDASQLSDAEMMEGIYLPMDIKRFRLEVAQAHMDYPPGERRWKRLHALYLFQLYKNLGTLQREAGHWQKSVHPLKQALDILPDDGYIYAMLGDAYAHQGQRGEAIAAYGRAVALEPFFIEAQRELARLFVEDRRFADATAFISDVLLSHLTADENRIELYLLLSRAFAGLGDSQAASAQLEEGRRELETGVIRTNTTQYERSKPFPTDVLRAFRQRFETAMTF